jgi:CRP-like cAMP-binding protein/membrane protease YdiL (CAAX protease family)
MTASLHFAPREDDGGLRLPDLLRLKRLAELVEPTPGGTLLEEGVPADALFLVRRGEVVVEKRDADGHPRVLARLGEGAVFGELSFLDGQPASATIRAAEAAQVARLPRQRLDSDPALAGLKARLITHLAREVVARLRTTDGSFTEALRAEGRQARLRTELGWFLMVTVGLFGLGQVVQRVIVPGLPPLMHMAYSWGLLLVIVALMAAFIRAQHAPLAAFGLTTRGARRSLLEGLAVGAGLVAILAMGRALSVAPGEALVTWGSVAAYGPTESALFFALYGPHCLLQELVARGVIQGSLERYLGDRNPRAGLLVASAMFGIFHLHVSLAFAATTFGVSLVFGLLYARHRSLAGPTAAHFLLGLASVAFGLN